MNSKTDIQKLDKFKNMFNTDLNLLLQKHVKLDTDFFRREPSNMTVEEWRGLNKMKKDKDLIIVQTDKNMGLAAINRDYYIKTMNEAFSKNSQTFKNVTQFTQHDIYNPTTKAKIFRAKILDLFLIRYKFFVINRINNSSSSTMPTPHPYLQ